MVWIYACRVVAFMKHRHANRNWTAMEDVARAMRADMALPGHGKTAIPSRPVPAALGTAVESSNPLPAASTEVDHVLSREATK